MWPAHLSGNVGKKSRNEVEKNAEYSDSRVYKSNSLSDVDFHVYHRKQTNKMQIREIYIHIS